MTRTKSQKTTQPQLVLSASRDIPFSQLLLSQKNVRRLKAGLSIADLAEDIARRTLLQSLNVRAELDAEGRETGRFEVPAGGRRFRALELLVKAKRMAKDQPVPCVVREGGIAEEDSLAENVMRVALHPLDQYRAFASLIEAGLSEDDIAARFFVSLAVVRQRLRLASIAPSLLEVYGEDGMTLEQLMAFSVTTNHARQEQVWEQVSASPYISAHQIRRLLTEDAVATADRRVRFIGLNAYTEAGGYVMRDLFSHADEGWLQDPVLVEQLVNDKLAEVAAGIAAEGWKWVEASIDLPYGCERGLRRIVGTTVPLTDDEQARLDVLSQEFDALGEAHQDDDDLPDDVAARLNEVDAEISRLVARPEIYDADEQARAGVFVSLAHDGRPRIERGFVRTADEAQAGSGAESGAEGGADGEGAPGAGHRGGSPGATVTVGGQVQGGDVADGDDDVIRPLPDRLVAELTAERTVALRDALARAPDAAFLALLQALCLSVFYAHRTYGCVQIGVTQAWFGNVAPNLRRSPWSLAIQERHDAWAARLPNDLDDLWAALVVLDAGERMDLLAHCVSLGVNALFEPTRSYDGRVSAHAVDERIRAADALASVVGLDMAEAGWVPSAENYLGRVTKPRIVEAVREARGEATAVLIEHLKKGDMAREAQRLLEGTGWLPEPLRLPPAEADLAEADLSEPDLSRPGTDVADLPDFLNDDEARDDEDVDAGEQPFGPDDAYAVAAE